MQPVQNGPKASGVIQDPPILTVTQTRALEAWAMERLGIPSLVLMENAARNIAGLVFHEQRFPPPVAIIAGRGNNGGDGLAIARQLDAIGIASRAMLIGPLESCGADCRLQAGALTAAGYPLAIASDGTELTHWLQGAGCVVDAIFGVGLSRPLAGPFARAVEAINASGLPVLAVDVPSGLDADSGKPVGDLAVRATLTASIGGLKAGLTDRIARPFTGELVAVGLGLPRDRLADPCATAIRM
jgi:NAD(P)H-hydrate epimerase